LLVGALYVFTTYAVDVAYGPGKFAGFTSAGPASWEGIARSLYGIFWFFVFLAIVNSTIANANAGVNVASRTAYAMGRIGAFPYWFARVHLRHHSPYVAILLTSVVTLAVALGLGFGYDPITAFAMVGTAIVIVLAAIYIVANAACIGYFIRRRRDQFQPIAHIVVPVLGILAFIPAWLTAAGLPAFSFISKLTPPISYVGPGVAAWMVIGIVYLLWLSRRHPERVNEVARVHLDEEPEVLPETRSVG
jgi:amino acid transporter